jgi:hypothetical protein
MALLIHLEYDGPITKATQQHPAASIGPEHEFGHSGMSLMPAGKRDNGASVP